MNLIYLKKDELQRVKSDISVALEVWSEILQDQEFAYVKGSAIKKWDTAIDYVPIISDVDIHFKPEKNHSRTITLGSAIDIVSTYDSVYKREQPDYYHIPRIQLMDLSALKRDAEYIPPLKSQVIALVGDPEFETPPTSEIIKNIDRKKVKELEDILTKLPMSVIDRRSEKELWNLLRRLTWRVSPTPTRILTQVLDNDPLEIWNWNRTKIVRKLRSAGISTIAERYRQYYQLGWDLFYADFNSQEIYFKMITKAHDLFGEALEYVNLLQAQDLGI